MTTNLTRSVQPAPAWDWTLAYGILSILIDLLAFAAPFPASLAATIAIGISMAVAGVASLVAAFRNHSGRGHALLVGVLSVLVGGYMALAPIGGALSLTLMLILWLGARGIAELIIGFRFKRLRVPMLLLGALNLVLAILLIIIVLAIMLYTTVPWSALTLPGYILGASFLFGGIVAIMGALHDRREQAA